MDDNSNSDSTSSKKKTPYELRKERLLGAI